MSVLLPKDETNNTKVTSQFREKSPRQKSGQTNKQQNRDSLHLVNEKNANNLQSIEQDDDSETENLSPLLYHKNNKKSQMKHGKKGTSNGGSSSSSSAFASPNAPIQFPSQQIQSLQSALHIDGVIESIDDTDTDIEERDSEVIHSNK